MSKNFHLVSDSQPFSDLSTPYFGKLLGTLSNTAEGLSAEVYALDEATVLVANLSYSGESGTLRIYELMLVSLVIYLMIVSF